MRRARSTPRHRHLGDEALLVHIKARHCEACDAYGWPRIWRNLVARGIRAKGKRRATVTTESRHELPISTNLLDHEFTLAEPDKV